MEGEPHGPTDSSERESESGRFAEVLERVHALIASLPEAVRVRGQVEYPQGLRDIRRGEEASVAGAELLLGALEELVSVLKRKSEGREHSSEAYHALKTLLLFRDFVVTSKRVYELRADIERVVAPEHKQETHELFAETERVLETLCSQFSPANDAHGESGEEKLVA
jgi:hypothetical protein